MHEKCHDFSKVGQLLPGLDAMKITDFEGSSVLGAVRDSVCELAAFLSGKCQTLQAIFCLFSLRFPPPLALSFPAQNVSLLNFAERARPPANSQFFQCETSAVLSTIISSAQLSVKSKGHSQLLNKNMLKMHSVPRQKLVKCSVTRTNSDVNIS